jgi:hypothetical protein
MEGNGLGRTPQEKEMLHRDIESTDQAIDALVYQLYGLTEAEIKIVKACRNKFQFQKRAR